MKQIDKYIQSIYKDVVGSRNEVEDLKREMRSHLIEAVEELKAEGKTEEEAIRIAINNFGGESQMIKGLSEFFTVQKKFTTYMLIFSVVFLVLSAIFFITSYSKADDYKEELDQLKLVEEEKEIIMNDVFDVLDATNEVGDKEKYDLLDIFNKYDDKLNLVAVFSAKDVEGWLQDKINAAVKEGPKTHFPIDYTKATIVIGNDKVIEDKAQIVPSNYDKGTVIMANDNWVVQYEYRTSYEKTVEKHLQYTNYGPSIWSFYQFPILFFVLFIVLGGVWLFLNRQNKRLRAVMD
ncbi:permease prefix domain 1-containing protein [Fictibacillus nanhaiensis]|uniref:permease prefix domain 1-containing protein n=1 Tax=Fictibacillus nanhaiensis TaxID=742169 RepID=UPI002E1A5F0E|nr:permease prefix domain 1-containing protein [Fictibacillus nanhaiensis]